MGFRLTTCCSLFLWGLAGEQAVSGNLHRSISLLHSICRFKRYPHFLLLIDHYYTGDQINSHEDGWCNMRKPSSVPLSRLTHPCRDIVWPRHGISLGKKLAEDILMVILWTSTWPSTWLSLGTASAVEVLINIMLFLYFTAWFCSSFS